MMWAIGILLIVSFVFLMVVVVVLGEDPFNKYRNDEPQPVRRRRRRRTKQPSSSITFTPEWEKPIRKRKRR